MNRNASSKGPGRADRKGMSLLEIMRKFPTDRVAEAWFVKTRWPDGVSCPHCQSDNVLHVKSRKPQPYRCRSCRKHFSTKTGTLMQGSNLDFQTWALAFFLVATGIKGTSSMKLHRDLGVTQKTAWHLAHRIRETWREQAPQFIGPVEADETFVGGKEINKHANKKLRAGRGKVGKVPVAGVKDRATGQVSAAVVPDIKRATLQPFVESRTKPGATIFTDEWWGYRNLPNRQAVRHGVGQWVDGQAHTNGLESFWSLLKRGYAGSYHKMSPKHLDRYVREFEGRHNQREADTIDQVRRMVRGTEGKRLRYQDLTAGGPAYPK